MVEVALERAGHPLELEQRFDAFVGTHLERARRTAWRLVGGDEAAAEDVAQDALLKAWRNLGRFRDESKLETWFYRILVNQALDHRRWRAVRRLWSEPRDPDSVPAGTGAQADALLRERIGRSLDRLSRNQRAVFVLIHLEGFSIRETAGILGKAEGTVKSHLHRALRSLRSDLRDLRTEVGASA